MGFIRPEGDLMQSWYYFLVSFSSLPPKLPSIRTGFCGGQVIMRVAKNPQFLTSPSPSSLPFLPPPVVSKWNTTRPLRVQWNLVSVTLVEITIVLLLHCYIALIWKSNYWHLKFDSWSHINQISLYVQGKTLLKVVSPHLFLSFSHSHCLTRMIDVKPGISEAISTSCPLRSTLGSVSFVWKLRKFHCSFLEFFARTLQKASRRNITTILCHPPSLAAQSHEGKKIFQR